MGINGFSARSSIRLWLQEVALSKTGREKYPYSIATVHRESPLSGIYNSLCTVFTYCMIDPFITSLKEPMHAMITSYFLNSLHITSSSANVVELTNHID